MKLIRMHETIKYLAPTKYISPLFEIISMENLIRKIGYIVIFCRNTNFHVK